MTSVQQITEQEEFHFGWVESIATKSISDFKLSKADDDIIKTDEKDFAFTYIFKCHIIFYMIFCYALLLYVFIDLGLVHP